MSNASTSLEVNNIMELRVAYFKDLEFGKSFRLFESACNDVDEFTSTSLEPHIFPAGLLSAGSRSFHGSVRLKETVPDMTQPNKLDNLLQNVK